jgi:hypothetical protein
MSAAVSEYSQETTAYGPLPRGAAAGHAPRTRRSYKPGEFCPKVDLGKTIMTPYRTWKCIMETGKPCWHQIE